MVLWYFSFVMVSYVSLLETLFAQLYLTVRLVVFMLYFLSYTQVLWLDILVVRSCSSLLSRDFIGRICLVLLSSL